VLSKDKNWLVAKFGGTSVSSLKSWQTIYEIISSYKEKNLNPLIVCSALSSVSTKLDRLSQLASQSCFKEAFDELKKNHLSFADELQLDSQAKDFIEEEFKKLEKLCLGLSFFQKVSPDIKARILSFGELLLTRLACFFLEKTRKLSVYY